MMSIQPLPPDVIAQIKSSTAITTLNGVILELVQNSFDADSTKVDINVEYARGGCIVEDNGLGILPSEFGETGGLGKLYHSSRLASQTPVYGGRGIFLASLSAVSLLSITSHHYLHRSHNSMSMHKSLVISRQIPSPAQQRLAHFNHGTRVAVRDLFGNMPVRVKQRSITAEKHGGNSKDWESLKRDLVALLLAWPPGVTLTLRDTENNQRMFLKSPGSGFVHESDTGKVWSILSQAGFATTEERLSWISVKASTGTLAIEGAFSLIPAPAKNLQFIAFGIQPLLSFDGRSILHDEINRLFQNSAFGNEEIEDLSNAEKARRLTDARYKSDGFTNKEMRGAKKGVDRWPTFYINIQQRISQNPRFDVDDILDDKGNTLGAIIELLQAMIMEFLTKNHFRPARGRGSRIAKVSAHEESTPASSVSNLGSVDDRNIKRTKSSYTPLSNSDLLGGNVKLPSFRQTSSSDSPFDAWSRVKSGAPSSTKLANQGGRTLSPLRRPATAPLPSRHCSPGSMRTRASNSTPNSNRQKSLVKSALPLITSTGKINRRPFDDIEAPKAHSETPQAFPNNEDIGKDDEITWINPITKVESLVNRRTGHTRRVGANNEERGSMAPKSLRLAPCKSLAHASSDQQPSKWIQSLLKDWDNPIYRPTEATIPQISIDGPEGDNQRLLHGHKHNCSQIDIDKAFKEVSAGINGRLSKEGLWNAEIIGQVDKKFILVKVRSSKNVRDDDKEKETMLVIIDQHAADERIRIENLLSDLCTPPPPNIPTESRILTTPLTKPLNFDIPSKEIDLLRLHKQHFSNWGILFSLPSPTDKENKHLTVHSLPPTIAERCTTTPRLLIDLIRTEIHHISSPSTSTPYNTNLPPTDPPPSNWLFLINTIPRPLLDLLNSRACRSAIMFNDALSKQQCAELVKRLSECWFPFQCAHGRVSLVPLVGWGALDGFFRGHGDRGGQGGFGRGFTRWKVENEGGRLRED